jgi:hypothetical protein
MNNSNNFNDILSVLDTINKEVNVPVFVPSLNREVKFKSINTGQQKTLLKAAVDNPVFQTRFTIALYNLILENCTEKSIMPALTTIDSAAIAIQLRVFTNGVDHILQQNNRRFKVNLQDIVDKIKSIPQTKDDTIISDPFTINVGAPTFMEQFNLEKQLREKTVNDQQVMSAQLTETIGDAFIGEVSKFIKEITVTKDGADQQFNYKNLPYTKRHAVLEKIPTTSIKGVLKYMADYVNIQKDFLTITGTDVDTGEVVNDLVLLVDTTLFIIS